MPPSPSFRRSPRMETHGDSHRRGRSLECGLSFKERNEDLALFNEMQTRESENFLLQATDDIEEILSSNLKPFPGLKLGIKIPARGESGDLLNTDGDKNDYEWLLTPPDTPLFQSLDDEPAPANLIQSGSGRDRSRPISVSRSSTMGRNQSSRGSLSPQRVSRSPHQSGSSAFHGRPSSAPHSNPVPLRPSSPSRRLSPPPVKASTPPRSLTPTSQTSSVGSGGSRSRSSGASPVRTSRGNSASPKIRAWQSNIPGFSLESPPNLRTSLADRPASYVRGSSPASRTSRNSPSKFGRRSMSPTATRSISSSHSQDRDRLSSHSRGSVASSGDDDGDSLQSVSLSASEFSMSRNGVGGTRCSKPFAFSKKPVKALSANSAPKQSFDSAMRQMDRNNVQNNMFRPLLSGVQSSTLYAGKSSSVHRTMVSRNSSVTTSSNTEESDQYQDDAASECKTTPYVDIQDEEFAYDKTDVANDETRLDALPQVQLDDSDQTCALAFNVADVPGDFVENDSLENTLVCSRCACLYRQLELQQSDDNICPECKQKERISTNLTSLISSESTPDSPPLLMNVSEESNVTNTTLDGLQLLHVVSTDDPRTALQEEIVLENKGLDSQPSKTCLDQSVPMVSEPAITEESQTVCKLSDAADDSLDVQKCSKKPENVGPADVTGISVLLFQRSSSSKGPLIHGRSLNSSAVSYDDLSYTRDFSSSTMSSIGHGSASTLTSVDLGSTRHGEMHLHRHWTGRRSDPSSRAQSTISSLSGSSMHVYQGLAFSIGSHEENYEGCSGNMSNIFAGEMPESPSKNIVVVENTESSVSKTLPQEEDSTDIYASHRENDTTATDKHTACNLSEGNFWDSIVLHEGDIPHPVDEDNRKGTCIVQNAEDLPVLKTLVSEENTQTDNGVDQAESGEDPPLCSLPMMSEIEICDSHPSSPRSQIDVVYKEDLEDHPTHTHPKKEDKALSLESHASVHADELIEKSTVTVEDRGGRTRSMTLEEATDTILFCSSIVHDLAYKAASIAIEKEKENLQPFEVSRLTTTIPEEREDSQEITTGRSTKARKVKKRHTEAEQKQKPPLTENDNRLGEPVVRNVGFPKNGNSFKLESKCNCTIM